MSETDMEYFRHRAAVERELARKAATPKVAAIHDELARGYDLLVEEPKERNGQAFWANGGSESEPAQ